MRSSILTVAVWFVALSLLGCDKPTAPTVEQDETAAAAKPDWRLVTLHVEGFKKSKSGGT